MIFIDNKYTRIYYMIIERAQSRTLTSYTEIHHIVPRSLGGSNNADNLVSLTPREHFICHLLLPKMLTGENKYKMLYAYIMMSGRQVYHSKSYSLHRREYSNLLSEQMSGEGNPMHGVDRSGKKNTFYGRTHTQESREKISKAKQGQGKGIKKAPFTTEHRKAIGQAKIKSASRYNFIHDTHGELFISNGELSRLFNIIPSEVYKLSKGYYNSYKGWRIKK